MSNYRPFAYLGLILSLVVLAAVFTWILVRFGAPEPTLVEVGATSDYLEEQEPRIFSGQGISFFVLNFNGELIAVTARSTHSHGCKVHWSVFENQFIDPCLGTHFSPQGAYRGKGPPGELERLPVEMRDGLMWVNLGYR